MTSRDIGIYINSDTVQYHLCQFKNSQPFVDCKIYREVDLFLNSQHLQKIAVLHIPYPFDSAFTQLVDAVTEHCDHVFVTCTEVHPTIVDFIQEYDHTKITYYICGFLNFKLTHSPVHQFMDWFETSTYFYRRWLPELLHRLRPHDVKTLAFDVLLGRKKQHRDYVFECATKNPGGHILTYFDDQELDLGLWQWEQHGVVINRPIEWTVESVQYYGHPISVSQIVPITVYNQTAYTVIAETCWQNNFAFFTEKTVKPIIARRLFVVFAGQGYLANLRQLGFQTFDTIIDENYDLESDDLVRWQQAWDQVAWLKTQPQEIILEKVKPIVEHNFHVMMSTDWYDQFRQQLEQDFARIAHG